jgi:biopolymer transport protein ExbB
MWLIVGLVCLLPGVEISAQDADADAKAVANPVAAPAVPPAGNMGRPAMPSVWDLAVQGGVFMIPIAICSVVALAFSIERFLGTRASRIVPPKLHVAIQKLNTEAAGIDPRMAYEVCQKYPSPLANVIQTAILKVGRPHAELEKAVEDAVAREADEMAHNIRPINVSASISPLIGLLGTVQGMIMAFMVTSTTASTGAAKAQELAQGIYTALVTTFAGLCVSIPAVILANILEGRIERLLREMEDIFLEVLPQFERFEGKLRITRNLESPDKAGITVKGTAIKSAAPKLPAATSKPAAPAPRPVAAAVTTPDVSESAAKGPKGLWGVMGTGGQTTTET